MPDSELLFNSFEKHIQLSIEEWQKVKLAFTSNTLKKKSYFLRPGEICSQLVFVLRGCLRSYTTDEMGFEHILQFAPEGWWITDMNSILNAEPARLSIDAIEDSDVLLLSRERQEKLFTEIPQFERFFRIITEKSMAVSHSRLLDQVSLDAKERYLYFCKRYPGLIQRLPQKQIASYIGVTPEFLSKIKAEILKKK